MKATGIVRRIDDLGRVVIPKEIRRTLRIREGDPLEIFVDRDGEVILKKYSPIGELSDFAQDYAEALYENLHLITLVCDRDAVIAAAGAPKKEYVDRSVSSLVDDSMEKRKLQHSTAMGKAEIIKGYPEEYGGYLIVPVIAGGDPVGSVVLLSRKDGPHITDTEMKIATTAAAFLGKQMEQ